MMYQKIVRNRITQAFSICLMAALVAASARLQAQTGVCGGTSITIPFTDVPGSNIFFCSIAAAYFSGLTLGVSATEYRPADSVPREQMAAFITRTLDQSLRRGSRRAALRQWQRLQPATFPVNVGDSPALLECDGADIWVANRDSATVTRVRASDGRGLGSWGGATEAFGVAVAAGRIFITGQTIPGRLFSINPTQNAGAVTLVASNLGNLPNGITFDGINIWTANLSNAAGTGSISRFNLFDNSVGNFFAGFNRPVGILHDGDFLWVTDVGDNTLKRVSTLSGTVLETIAVGDGPAFPVFDGTNIWVPNQLSNSITVVRAVGSLRGTVLATLTHSGLNRPLTAAFDGERILVTSFNNGGVLMWKATDLTFLSVQTSANREPVGACSDGVNFWVSFQALDQIAKF